MAIIKWTFWGVIWLIIAAFFHYTLPQVDIVRITDETLERMRSRVGIQVPEPLSSPEDMDRLTLPSGEVSLRVRV